MKGRKAEAGQRPAAGPFRLGRALRDVPLAVWGLALLFFLVSGLYSVAVPLYQGPDEPQHVDMVLSVGRLEGWAPARQRLFSRQLRTTQKLILHERRSHFTRAAREAVPRSQRPSFDDLADEPPTTSVTHVANHPPLYYIAVAAWATLMTGLVPALWDPAFDEVVGVLRLGSGLLLMWLPVSIWLTGRRLGLRRSTAATAAALPLAIPQLAHLGGAVNNDALLVALSGVVFVLLSFVATGDTSRRTALMLGAAGGLALLSKGFALLLPVGVLLAYGAAVRRGSWWRALRMGLLALGTSFLVGGWWWVRNLVFQGRLQPSGGLPDYPHPPGFVPSVEVWRETFYLREIAGFWGAIGNLNVPLPLGAVAAAGGFLLLTIVVAFVTRREEGEPGRLGLLLLLLPVLMLGIFLPWRSWNTYATESTRIRGMQGRYLFLGLPGLATVSALGLRRFVPRRDTWQRWLPVAVLLGAVALHSVALHRVLFAYWGATEGNSAVRAFTALLTWSPWPRELVLPWSAVTGVVLLAVLVMLPFTREPAGESSELREEQPHETAELSPEPSRPRSHRRTRRRRRRDSATEEEPLSEEQHVEGGVGGQG